MGVGKSRVEAGELHALEGQKFKKSGDLVSFAASNPGALSAYFLSAVYAKLCSGQVTRRRHLKDVSVASWAARHTGLTETRDLREVQSIALAMDHINRQEVASAMDVLAQRVLSIQAAKTKGGSWERAERMELLPSSATALAPGAMLQLSS